MTLAQWHARNPDATVTTLQTGATHVMYQRVTRAALRELWRLDDHAVSSHVSGPAVILVPRLDTQSEATVPLENMGDTHAGDSRCVCTDGREAARDVCEPCV